MSHYRYSKESLSICLFVCVSVSLCLFVCLSTFYRFISYFSILLITISVLISYLPLVYLPFIDLLAVQLSIMGWFTSVPSSLQVHQSVFPVNCSSIFYTGLVYLTVFLSVYLSV